MQRPDQFVQGRDRGASFQEIRFLSRRLVSGKKKVFGYGNCGHHFVTAVQNEAPHWIAVRSFLIRQHAFGLCGHVQNSFDIMMIVGHQAMHRHVIAMVDAGMFSYQYRPMMCTRCWYQNWVIF